MCFMEGVCELPTSAPTMSWAKPGQEEGQTCQTFSPKIWFSLMRPVTIPLFNLGMQFFSREHTSPDCPHSGRKSGHRGSQSTLGTHPQQPIPEPPPWQGPGEGCRRINSCSLHYLNPWGGFATNLKQVLSWGMLYNEKLGYIYKLFRESGAKFQQSNVKAEFHFLRIG